MKSPDSATQKAGILQIREHTQRHERIVLISMLLILIVAVLLSMTIGRYSIPLHQLIEIFGEWFSPAGVSDDNAEASLVLTIIRIPRIVLTLMVGAALSVSGAAFQGLFKNPMVSPDILGVSSAAGAGAALAILLDFTSTGVTLTAFCFGIGAVLVVMFLAKAIGRSNGTLIIMVLSGVVVSSIFRALTSLTKYVADTENKLPEITFWLMGSFAKSGSMRSLIIMLCALLIGGIPLLVIRRKMNVLSFGEEEARAMGINTVTMRYIIIGCATLLTASSVCLCGSIDWVGLIVPHMMRLIVGPNYRVLLPASILGGSIFMVIVDNFCRVIIPGELPVGIMTSLLGAPLFVYLLIRGRRDWS